jgi:adenylate cyclase, class 2
MTGNSGELEIEIKLAVAAVSEARRRLRQKAFRVIHRRVFEANLVFDTPDRQLLAQRELLRLRMAGNSSLVTFKGSPLVGPHKSREEWETSVGDLQTASAILERLGFELVFRYEKYRTEFAGEDRQGIVMLDETPIGVWLELEGPPGWIDRTAAMLGFSQQEYITSSYGTLYRQYCESRNINPADMVFK